MSSPASNPSDPEVIIIKDKKDDGNTWLWAIFVIVLVAIILVVVGVCLGNKHCKKILVYQNSLPPSSGAPIAAQSSGINGINGMSGMSGSSMLAGGAQAVITPSMFASSAAPMSFFPY